MKNKKKTYSLLIMVICIWSYVGFRIIRTVKPKALVTNSDNTQIMFKPKAIKEKDTFSIQPVDRDPFLGTILVKEKKVIPKAKHTNINWMPITYHGVINKHNNKTPVYIISIGDQQYFMKPFQVINGVKLINANSKEILVTYKGERKRFLRL